MPDHTIKLPDVGEGVAEAELVEWHVKLGDLVREDTVIAAVMTDKATVEIPSPVDGEVTWLGGEVGDTIAVGSPLVRIAVGAKSEGGDSSGDAEASSTGSVAARGKPPLHQGNSAAMEDGKSEAPIADGMAPEGEDLPTPPDEPVPGPSTKPAPSRAAASASEARPRPATPGKGGAAGPGASAPGASAERVGAGQGAAGSRSKAAGPTAPLADKPLASPAVRQRAREAGIDLRQVSGTGPAGRITHEDLDAFAKAGAAPAPPAGLARNTAIEDIKVIGLRRRIAEKMSLAKSRIPHITYVEEIDVTALEDLRAALNKEKAGARTKLTLLPFLVRAMVKAIAEQPAVNALFDDEAGIIHRHGGVHVGIATQTPSGLIVPVVRHAEALGLWDCAAEIARLAEAARTGTATREELSGSTITISSLGAIGGIVSTPVINHPEVAIVGVNKIAVRPMWDGAQFVPRKMMNLSSGFDHRVIDGWDAASFIQRIKALLESPAMIFVD